MSEPTEEVTQEATKVAGQDMPDPELVAQYVEVVPTVDIVKAVYAAIERAQVHLRANWRKHPQEPQP